MRLRLTLTLLCIHFASGAMLAVEEPIPALRPPRGELLPSFWSQYGWWVAVASALVVGTFVLSFKRLRRSKPATVTPPGVLACAGLEVLRGQPEDGRLAVEVSRILRRYLMAAHGLAPDELTTAELQKALQSHPAASPEMVASAINFLRRCDEWKFAPAASTPQSGTVAAALELIEKTEAQRGPRAGAEPSQRKDLVTT